jgi:MFS family permease
MSDEATHRLGWRMVWITFVISGLAFGVLGSVGVFLKPLIAEFGWTRGEASFGYTAAAFSAATFGIVWGVVADRIGTRPLVLMGVVFLSLSLFVLSNQTALWQFYLGYGIFGALGLSSVTGPLYASIGHWFSRNAGLAMGVMASGAAVGQGAIPFIARYLITDYGWQTAYFAMACVYIVVGLPMALLIKDPPSRIAARKSKGAAADEQVFVLPPREIVTWISCAVVFCCICMSVPIVHVVAMTSDRGVDPQSAAAVLLLIMLAGAFGRILGGKVADMTGVLKAFLMMSLGQTVLVIWFPHVEALWLLYGFSILFGIFYSGVMATILVSLRVLVPARHAALAMGVGGFFGWAGMGLGGYFGGVIFDATGDYVWSFSTAALAGAVNLMILAALFLRVRRRTALAAA